jgi:hypothetical protein
MNIMVAFHVTGMLIMCVCVCVCLELASFFVPDPDYSHAEERWSVV